MRDRLPLQFLEPVPAPQARHQIASLWERANDDTLLGSFYGISEECRLAMAAWASIEVEIERAFGPTFSIEKVTALEFKRLLHQNRYPFLKRLQELTKSNRNEDPDLVNEWLPFLPYARFNVEAYLKKTGLVWGDFLIRGRLEHGRASILTLEEREKLETPDFTYGLSFIREKQAHIALRAECSSLVQALNLGYELIYLHELEMRERLAKFDPSDLFELVPSLENQKNLRYLEALGILLPFDPTRWAQATPN